jgi:hypothetical protein
MTKDTHIQLDDLEARQNASDQHPGHIGSGELGPAEASS